MIPHDHITAWSSVAPWASRRQIEQDLIISRAVIEIFSDPFLRGELRFRGGTALNKLHFPAPLRYSEDIDLVRTRGGPIGPLLDGIRAVLEPWLGKAKSGPSPVAPKLRFRADADGPPNEPPITLKVEINTRERAAYDPPIDILMRVDNPWFVGSAAIATFSREEMLATKFRALLQRNKGRDLFDLHHGLTVFEGLNSDRIVRCFELYLESAGFVITRAEAQLRMFQKLANPSFFSDMRPLLRAEHSNMLTHDALRTAFMRVMEDLVDRLPGDEWAKANDMREKFGVKSL